ncbi:Toxin Doc [Corynebacterium glaucum]|uniref:Toxin Doc n=1 Tax=Corynebacterium glaucum TaxID=187491 RepID=A0A1Q2HYE5_9CORY|nr:Fic family protein [Corynebacterium glaucum]AQQ15800.1 Toxin Doc [Corynebacterium glaucum]
MRFCLDPDEVVRLNRRLIGKNFNVLDRGKLEAALAAPLLTFGGQTLYPTPEERAVNLLFGVLQAHAFFDGNKRTAWVCFASYLDLEGKPLGPIPATEVADFVAALATHDLTEHEALLWLRQHLA